jgi:fibronectin-binding autotransporter adhesin
MATFTVTTATDTVADDGRLSLREAIAQADASAGPDTIRFAPDLEGSTLRLAGGPLVLSGGVTVDGDADGSGDRVTLDAHDAGRVLEIAGGGADVALHGLGITGGDVGGGNGGGILLGANSRLSLADVEVRGNSGGYDPDTISFGKGGGIFASTGSRLAIADSTIAGNDAENGGGVYAAPGSTVRIVGSTLEGNSVSGYRYGLGGGLYGKHSTITVEASTIADNRSDGSAAGITALDSRLTVTASTISGNRNAGGHVGYSDGGGIEVSGQLTLADSTVTGNIGPAAYGYGSGAGVALEDGTRATITNSIVAGNHVGGAGGRAEDITGTITRQQRPQHL